MGMTLEHIRRVLADKSHKELDVLFRSPEMLQRSGFPEDKRLSLNADGTRIREYEKAQRDVTFGTQHRYGIVSGTRTGIIHVISLLYAFLRCAAADEQVRAKQLDDALIFIKRLKALAVAAEIMIEDADDSGLLRRLAKDPQTSVKERLKHEDAVIGPLFEAYLGALPKDKSIP